MSHPVCPALSLIPDLKQDNQMQNAAVFESKPSAVTVFTSIQNSELPFVSNNKNKELSLS